VSIVALNPEFKVFGTVLRTRVLLAIALTGETFASELSRLIEARLFPVQRVLDALEREGLIVGRKIGVERRITLNPRYFARAELQALLVRLGEQDGRLQQALAQHRSRPRRRGKAM
jgi:hypothetical protein